MLDKTDIYQEALKFLSYKINLGDQEKVLQDIAVFLTSTVGFKYAIIGELDPDNNKQVTTSAFADCGKIGPNITYELKHTPCHNVVGNEYCCYPENIQELFPLDQILIDLGAESYAGIPLWNSDGVASGLIVVIDDSPIKDPVFTKEVMGFFANSASTALELQRKNRHLEEMLSELKLLETALDNHSIVSITDEKGVIEFANDKFCETSGYEKSELIGKNHSLLNSGHHSKKFFTDMWNTISSGKIWRGNIKNKKKNGETYWVKSTIVPFLKNGRINKYYSIRTDITDLIEREQELKVAKERAEELSNAKSNFISSMSHEFRTPLNAIIGFSDMINNKAFGELGNKKYEEYLEAINRSGEELLNLVNNILKAASLEKSDGDFKFEEISPLELSRGIIANYSFLMVQKNLKINLDIDKKVPEHFESNKEMLGTILSNLISNACKYSNDNDGVSVKWSLNEERNIVIKIKDQGDGMPEELLSQIGNPFTSGNDYKEIKNSQSSGMGLYICTQYADTLGYKLDFESEVGKGTEVTLTLSGI